MGGKIEAYVDCVSPYSFFLFKHLREQRALLSQHGVQVEFIPFFLGGVNSLSGNKPPWLLPAKAKYSQFDMDRASKHFGVQRQPTPEWFPIVSLLPQRAMIHIRKTYPREIYETTFSNLWTSMFHTSPPLNPSEPATLAQVLSRTIPSQSEISTILQEATTNAEVKAELMENTKTAVARGAFGAPFCWVVKFDDKGQEEKGEPFFGSDRFAFMWEFLGVPVSPLRILSREEAEREGRDSKAKI